MLAPEVMTEESVMQANIQYLFQLNMRRNETDNITAAVVRTSKKGTGGEDMLQIGSLVDGKYKILS